MHFYDVNIVPKDIEISTIKQCSCGHSLASVRNGVNSLCFFCVACKSVYVIKLVKVPKRRITKEFIRAKVKELKERYGSEYK